MIKDLTGREGTMEQALPRQYTESQMICFHVKKMKFQIQLQDLGTTVVVRNQSFIERISITILYWHSHCWDGRDRAGHKGELVSSGANLPVLILDLRMEIWGIFTQIWGRGNWSTEGKEVTKRQWGKWQDKVPHAREESHEEEAAKRNETLKTSNSHCGFLT